VTLRELQCFALGLSALVYEYNLQGLERILTLEGFERFEGFNPGSASGESKVDQSKIGMCFRSGPRAWLVFRGSDDRLDWDTNLQFSKTEDNIHRGFWTASKKLRSGTLDCLAKLDGEIDEVVIAGHSLGGALAVLAAREISAGSRLPITAVFTFGAPCVGGKAFVNDYNQRDAHALDSSDPRTLGQVTWQLRQESDIVPKLPLRISGYRHCGENDQVLWSARFEENRDGYMRKKYGQCPNDQESSGRPLQPIPETNVLREFTKFLTKVASFLLPHIELLFSGLNRAGESRMSHRMKEYRNYFQLYTSFWRATDRQEAVLEAIRDKEERGETPASELPAFMRPPDSISFEVEQSEGWTFRLTLALLCVAGLFGFLVCLLFWSVQATRAEIRWAACLFVIYSLMRFVIWYKRRL
jgi:hypothetical protein